MISFKLLTLASALLLSSISVEAVYIAVQQQQYNKYCSPGAKPDVGAICFDTDFDFGHHFKKGLDGKIGYMNDAKNSIAIPLGNPETQAEFETLQHKVSMIAWYKKDWSDSVCVQYAIDAIHGATDSRTGHYCPGYPHVRL